MRGEDWNRTWHGRAVNDKIPWPLQWRWLPPITTTASLGDVESWRAWDSREDFCERTSDVGLQKEESAGGQLVRDVDEKADWPTSCLAR